MTISLEPLERIPVDTFWSNNAKRGLLNRSIELALTEDLNGGITGDLLREADGDITTNAIVDPNLKARAVIYCKQADVLVAGLPVIDAVFACLGKQVSINRLVSDGTKVETVPQVVAVIEGNARDILTAERTIINLVQRLSGIATTTRKYAEMAQPHGILILDTRKTTPGLRVFERYAVTVGGGTNHRFGLYEAVLIKDNHIEIAGSVSAAISKVKDKYPQGEIEVECASLDQVQECLRYGVDKIMLDNMSPDMVAEAIGIVKGRCFIEVSGGINLTNIEGYLQPGVNAISIGALTHSVASVDFSLEVESYA
jgi:nicotinate-nucleotide pyrophosphorylase (carboxylating)